MEFAEPSTLCGSPFVADEIDGGLRLRLVRTAELHPLPAARACGVANLSVFRASLVLVHPPGNARAPAGSRQAERAGRTLEAGYSSQSEANGCLNRVQRSARERAH